MLVGHLEAVEGLEVPKGLKEVKAVKAVKGRAVPMEVQVPPLLEEE